MLLKYFYDKSLAHASYMIGCQKTGQALIIDPGRDIQPYIDAAESEDLVIVGAAETHIHADFVSGSREIAARFDATLYLSDEGPADWKYRFADQYRSDLVKEGEAFYVGKVKLEVMHTPGHTPESISFLLTDEGGGATEPMGIFTGDFIFVGSIGRPDLLETAAGITGSAKLGARELFQSAQRFKAMPDHLQVWPAHGAGSACGKGLGAIPSSTVGYEKRFNPALQFDVEQDFVDYILSDQPETPNYFAIMKRVNKEGPPLLGDLDPVAEADFLRLGDVTANQQVIDASPSDAFARAHLPGSFNIPIARLGSWAGWFVDYDKPLFLVANSHQKEEAVRVLRSIGIDRIAGCFDSDAITTRSLMTDSYRVSDPATLRSEIESGKVTVVDVRAQTEWDAGHIEQAKHFFLGSLISRADQIDKSKAVVTYCESGARSAIAASILQARGNEVIDMRGGLAAWRNHGLSIVEEKNLAATV